jgi:hypothetical protein
MKKLFARIKKIRARLARVAQQITFSGEKMRFAGKAKGRVQWGDLLPETKAWYREACFVVARTLLGNVYAEGLNDPKAKAAMEAFAVRMYAIAPDEDPIVLLHTFLEPYRQVSFLDWRAAGDTLRSATRRENRVARGDISGETRNFREVDEDEESMERFARKVKMRDMVFPLSFTSDQNLDAFCAEQDVRLDIEGIVEGLPTIKLEANPQGSWALYALQEDGVYRRTFMMREMGYAMPRYGEPTAGHKVGEEVRYG